MVSRLVIRDSGGGLPAWLCDAVPLAYEEAGKQQFGAMPGVQWVRDKRSPNGRGFYRGPREAVEMVSSVLESAGVVKLQGEASRKEMVTCSFAAPWPPAFRDYQRDGAAWCASMLLHTRGALLADDMGVGKSAQALAACDALGIAEALVVCPAIVKSSWAEQHSKWRGSGSFTHVLSYEIFTKLVKKAILPEHGIIVFDEGQYLSNPKSLRSKAAAAWREQHPDVPALALSGTPMNARPRDLWHLLNVLWPGRFGSQWQFEKRYCDGKFEEIPNAQRTVWIADGSSRAPELATRLAGLMLRRTKSQVALELPPRTRSIIEVELAPAARKALAKAAQSIDGSGGVSALLSNVEEYKLDACCELVEQARAAGERVLVLTTRRESAAVLGRRLNAPSADGDDSVEQRRAKLEHADVAVATLYSVGVGVNYLSGFSTLIFAGLDWLPSVILQGEARVHRIGQANPVTIYYLIGKGTLDEVVRERVLERLEVFASIAGAGDDSLGADLGGGSEDELLAGIVAAVRKAA